MVEVVLDALAVGSEEKLVSGVCLLMIIIIYRKDYDTSTIDQINNINDSDIKDKYRQAQAVHSTNKK